MRASDIMTSLVITVRPDTPIKGAAALLTAQGYTALPVVARDDHTIAQDVRHRLETSDSERHWQVEVCDGMVTIGMSIDDELDDETDRHVATVLAEAVPGVVRATVGRHP